jgi:cytochrome b
MLRKLIYDLPTRIFHWGFAALFITAFLIAKTIDDDNPLFSYHMLAGLLLGALVVFRLIWGVVGSRYARFSSFALHPADLIAYFKGILMGDQRRWAGHHPASSWATLVMLGCATGLAITGYLMSTGNKETFEDIHELLANGFLVTVLLHIAGVVIHSLRHRDAIAVSMLDGKKSEVAGAAEISSSYPLVALVLILGLSFFGFYLSRNYDSTTRQLNLFGTPLSLGEEQDSDS